MQNQPFKLLHNNVEYLFYKPHYLQLQCGRLLRAKVKGSTLGWYCNNKWISYNQLTQYFKNKNTQKTTIITTC